MAFRSGMSALLAGGLAAALALGCERDERGGAGERAGRKLDEAGEQLGKAVENVGEAIQEAAKPEPRDPADPPPPPRR
jgi:hypothetical protein